MCLLPTAVIACSGATSARNTTEPSSWRENEAGPSAGDGDTPDPGDGDREEMSDASAACASVEQHAISRKLPIDIILVVDNSGSMSGELRSVRDRINADFARIIEDSGVDYRVVLVSRYEDGVDERLGTSHGVCIDPPLSSAACEGQLDNHVTNGERFVHYSADVDSNNAWCVLLDSLDRPDEYMQEFIYNIDVPKRDDWQPSSPNGWGEFLRKDAFKQVVVFSDDVVNCITERAYADVNGQAFEGGGFSEAVSEHPEMFSDFPQLQKPPKPADFWAKRFDLALLSRPSHQFGKPGQRNYRFHAVFDFAGNKVLGPEDPITDACPVTGACFPSITYQALSIMTGGLRYPIERYDNFDEIFHELAKDTIALSQLSCAWSIPAPPDGESLAPDQVNLVYRAEGEKANIIPKSNDACASGSGWRYDDESQPTHIEACEKTCATLRADATGSVAISFGCATVTVL